MLVGEFCTAALSIAILAVQGLDAAPAGETSIAGSAYPVTPHVKAHETSHTGGWNPDPDHNDPNDNPPDGYSDDDTNSDSDDYSDDDPNDDLNDGSSDGQDFSNDGSGDGQDNSDDGSGDGQDSSDGPGDGQDDGQDDSNDDSDGSYPDNSSYGEHSTPTKGQEIPTKTLATTVTFTITNGSDCDTPPYSSDAPAVTIYKGAPQGNKRDDSGEAGSYWKGTSTITKTVTKTETVDAVCPTDPAAVGCAEGLVYEKLGFDGIEGYDSSQSFVTETPILYKDFTFEDYSLAFCENIEGKEDRVCEPATYEGDHFVALYSQANGRQSSLFHRITYEIENSDSKFQLLNFKLSAFPNGEPITVVICGWNIGNQYNGATPSWCQVEYISEDTVLRPVIFEGRSDLAFVGIGAVASEFVVPNFGDVYERLQNGVSAAPFFIDDIAVCHPPSE